MFHVVHDDNEEAAVCTYTVLVSFFNRYCAHLSKVIWDVEEEEDEIMLMSSTVLD